MFIQTGTAALDGHSATLDINVGHFTSIPWIPCYSLFETWPVNLIPCESSGVRELANQARVDFTPMAVADWFELERGWRRLRNFGIGIHRKADSVLFFSQQPLHELDAAPIAICGETANSVRALQAVLKGRYGLRIGKWQRGVDEDDATTPRLLIQNQAVEERNRRRFEYVYDLGEEWFSWQGTPLVSAVWVHREDADPAAVEAVENLLFSSLQRYRANPAAAISDHRRRHGWGMSVEEIQRLHKNFEYELGDMAELGIERQRAVIPVTIEGFEKP